MEDPIMKHLGGSAYPLALGILLVGCGGGGGDQAQTAVGDADAAADQQPAEAAREAETWIEYSITGDFAAEERDLDTIMCSETDEGWVIASRGAWTIDMELGGVGTGERTGELQLTVPGGTDGAPDAVSERRMKAIGSVTIGDLDEGTMGMRKIEMEFAATGLRNDDGQSVDFSGRAVCLVF
jgi:hypothetical protein